MIDYHSHVLPGIDDGARSTDESLELIRRQKEQGAAIVCATPHFIAESNDVGTFLARREAAFRRLKPLLPADSPEIRLGAEVAYYPGVSRLPELEKLRLQGTQILLLEMPFRRWTDSVRQELIALSCRPNLTVMIAHIERYLFYQPAGTIDELLGRGFLIQANAEFFLERRTRRKAFRMLKKEQIDALGTDCHNLGRRPPNLSECRALVEKKMGADFFRAFARSSSALIREYGSNEAS